MMKAIRIPAGTRDILPREAAELRRLEDAIRGVFAGFGYGEVATPTLELESSLELAGEQRLRRSFRLFDELGDVLVLRQEMTTPIARLVATKMRERETPLRLCYFANAFRPTEPQRGRRTEFRQAGLEFIGDDSPAADAEAIAVLCEALEVCGLSDYAVALGEASFFQALLDDIGVDGDGRGELFDALAARDMVRFGERVATLDASADDRQAIVDTVSLRGGSDVLTRAQDLVRTPAMEDALKRLARTSYIVSRYGYAEKILFDLGILRDFDYYTGVVFEVLTGSLGFPIGGGGRYNNLLARFGRSEPAIGFALGLDRLQLAAGGEDDGTASAGSGLLLVGGLDEELDLAGELRAAGAVVFAMEAGTSSEAAITAARAGGLAFVAVPGDESVELIDAGDGSRRVVARAALAGEVVD